MRTVYRVLAYAIAALVAIQAGAIGYAVFAEQNWVDAGGTLNQTTADSGAPGNGALLFHAIDGGVVLLVALALLIVSFFAKVQGGVRWAAIVLVATIVQIALGSLSHLLAAIGAVHGAVALVLFGTATMAAMRSGKVATVDGAVVTNAGGSTR